MLPRASHLQQGGVYPRCSGVGLGGQELKATGWLLSVSGQRLVGWSTNWAVEARQLAPGHTVRREPLYAVPQAIFVQAVLFGNFFWAWSSPAISEICQFQPLLTNRWLGPVQPFWTKPSWLGP